jgi:hypothetical protein
MQFFRFISGQNCPRGRDSHEVCRPKPKLRKHTNMSFGSNGEDWERSLSKKSTASFFRSTNGQNGTRGGFRTRFVDRNRNCENTPNMSFGPTGWIGCVRCGKINYKFFRSNQCQNGPTGQVSHEFCRPKPKLRKRTRHEFWVKWEDWVQSFRKKSTASFFA